MKTNFDLPAALINEAMKVSGLKNKRATIIVALENLVRKNRILGIKRYKGKVDLKLSLSKLRGRR